MALTQAERAKLTAEELAEYDELVGSLNMDIPVDAEIGSSKGQKSWYSPENLASNPITQGVLGFGDSWSNLMSSGANEIISALTGNAARKPMQAKFGSGNAYDVGSFVGEMAPYFVPGPQQSTLPLRVLSSAGISALQSPEDQLKGAAFGGAGQIAGEALGGAAKLGGKLAGGLSEKFTRQKYLENLISNLASSKKSAESNAFENLLPRNSEIGGKLMPFDQADNVVKEFKNYSEYMGPKDKLIYKEFKALPTIENAHRLQSQLFSSANGLNLSDVAGKSKSEAIDLVRKEVLSSLKNSLSAKGEKYGDMYSKYLKDFATDVVPYSQDKLLKDALEGITADITPSKLYKSIEKSIQKYDIPPSHPISMQARGLKEALDKTDLYSAAAGGLAGLSLGGGQGALLGAMLPKAVSAFKPDAGIIVNKELKKGLKKVGGKYKYIKPSFAAAASQMQQDSNDRQ